MVLCCKDSTIFSLSPHLCATDFPDKEHSHDFLLFFRSSSPLSVLTLAASHPAHLTFRPFLLAFVKATAHLLRKTRELFGKTPQLLAKSSLVFRNSRAHLHLIQARSLVCPPFSHRWPCILAAILPPPHNIYPSISTWSPFICYPFVPHALFLPALAFTLPPPPHRFGLLQNPNRPCQPESPHASTAKRFSRMKHARKFPHKKLVSGSFLGNSVSKQEAMTQFYRIYTISRLTFPLFASQVLTLKPIIGRTLQKCEEKYGHL